MLGRFWLHPTRTPAAPAIPKGFRVYAIGDVHGRDDLLVDLLGQIEDERAQTSERVVLVFLGDLIDRGPHSSTVLERLSSLDTSRFKAVFLMGNHEEAVLRVLDGDTSVLKSWLQFGGKEFIESYGLRAGEVSKWQATKVIQALRAAMPERHVSFLRSFHDSFRAGDYFFTHAGIRPGVPLEEQKSDDMRWIRAPFLEHEGGHGAVIVHGHTITSEVDERSNRIGIDTGAYKTGVLTALALSGRERWVLQASASDDPAYSQ